MTHSTHSLLLQLKGAPLSVFLALGAGPRSRDEIIALTGWSRNAVRQALALLVKLGLVTRPHYRCWRLAAGVRVSIETPFPDFSIVETSCADFSAERPSADLSTPESPYGDLSAERAYGDLSAAERACDDLSDAERPYSDLSAERPYADLSDAESPYHDLSAGRMAAWPPPERSRRDLSAHHHDVVDDGNYDHLDYLKHHHHQHQSPPPKIQRVVRELHSLQPPFSDAAAWLQSAPLALVEGWLAHLRGLDRESRRRIRNQSAFLRAKVDAGEPPPPPTDPAARPPCPDCGRAYFDAGGNCLVCLGAISV